MHVRFWGQSRHSPSTVQLMPIYEYTPNLYLTDQRNAACRADHRQLRARFFILARP
jgi:hypothetical protein